jgi:hypothetical protein
MGVGLRARRGGWRGSPRSRAALVCSDSRRAHIREKSVTDEQRSQPPRPAARPPDIFSKHALRSRGYSPRARGTSPLLTPNPRRHYQSPMTNLTYLTVSQLKSILSIMEQIEKLQGQIDSIAGNGGEIPIPAAAEAPKKRRMSPAARARIAAAARARWAKIKGKAPAAPKPAKKSDRRSSPAVRAKLAAAARARWANAKAAGKKTL